MENNKPLVLMVLDGWEKGQKQNVLPYILPIPKNFYRLREKRPVPFFPVQPKLCWFA